MRRKRLHCDVEGCEEDAVVGPQCDEHAAESYADDKTIPVIARVADRLHHILEKHGVECFELTDDTPLCLAIAVYLDKHHHLKED